MELQHTDLFIVLDETTLLTMKGKHKKTAKFKTFEDANWAAAEKLDVWHVIRVKFDHPWVQHSC